jgi:DNA-binding NtrC family response regulator
MRAIMALEIEQLIADVHASEDRIPKPRVLVIDDEPAILEVLERVLERAELPVLTATTGELGLSLLEDEPSPGVVFVDKNLPDISGIEVIRRGKEIEPDAQFIMITGYASVESATKAMELGAFGYITKPFDSLGVIPERARAAFEKTRGVLYKRVLLTRLQDAYRELYAEREQLAAENEELRKKLAAHEADG